MNEPKKRLSYDEILQGMEEIARDPDDRDRFKALKALAASQSASMVLPEPLSRQERIDRAIRILKGLGYDDGRVALARAFSRSVGQRPDSLNQAPTLGLEDLTPEMQEKVRNCTSIKALYRLAPELKRAGTFPGYPSSKGRLAQKLFCQRAYAKYLVDKEQLELDRAAKIAAFQEDPNHPSWMRKRDPAPEAPSTP